MYLKALILFYINNKNLNSHVKLLFYTIIIRSNVVKVDTILLDSNKKSLNSKNLIVLDLKMLRSSNNKPLNARLEQRYVVAPYDQQTLTINVALKS